MRIKDNYKIIRRWIRSICFVICLMWFTGNVSEVHAQDYVLREATGDLEALVGIEVSDEQADEWIAEEKSQDSQDARAGEQYPFLEYGSDYGYQDMVKREHGEQRQALYRKLQEECREFTVDGSDASTVTVGADQYAKAFTVNLSELGLTDLTGYEKTEVYFTFRNDNPQYFWLANSVLYSSHTLEIVTYDEYADGDIRRNTLDEIVNTAETVYQSGISDQDHIYDKVLYIHDTLIADIEYSEDTTIPISHSIAGAMTASRSAVCEGYAKVMQVMMNSYDIENIYVTGYAGGGHAWNMVQMDDGLYYWLDATWDDQFYEEFRHDYFLVGNENFTDHIPDSPDSSGVNFLYELPEASDTDYVYDPSSGETGDVERLKGDINGDGYINLVDLMKCLNHVGRKELLETEPLKAADINGDGIVNLVDLMRLLNYVGRKSSVL